MPPSLLPSSNEDDILFSSNDCPAKDGYFLLATASWSERLRLSWPSDYPPKSPSTHSWQSNDHITERWKYIYLTIYSPRHVQCGPGDRHIQIFLICSTYNIINTVNEVVKFCGPIKDSLVGFLFA